MIRIIAIQDKEAQASFPADLGPFMMADDEKVPLEEMDPLDEQGKKIKPKSKTPPVQPVQPKPAPLPDEALDVPVAPEPPPPIPEEEPEIVGEPIVGPESEPLEPEPEEAEPFEEVTEETTELDKLNQTLPIRQKIEKSLLEGYPLRIIYTTLKGHTTERTVKPDYYLLAKSTGNMVLIAWCELRNAWRGFIVNRIRAAKLEPINNA